MPLSSLAVPLQLRRATRVALTCRNPKRHRCSKELAVTIRDSALAFTAVSESFGKKAGQPRPAGWIGTLMHVNAIAQGANKLRN
jgi:hypothetical protein